MEAPDLHAERERLWKRFARGRDKDSRNLLVEAYGFMVRYAVERVGSALPLKIFLERKGDMVSAGYLGLMDAVDRFSPSRGVKFETYGSRRVHGAVLDELRKYDWAPRRLRRRGREIREAARDIESRTGRSAEIGDLADKLGTTEGELSRDMDEIQASFMLPLESLTLTGDDGKPYARVDFGGPRPASPSEAAEEDDRLEKLTQAIRGLPEAQQKTLAFYFQEGLTLKEIGRLMDVSESRVSQIMKEAVGRLRTLIPAGPREGES